MKIMSLNELRRLADRASILVNVDPKTSVERVRSQFTSQVVRESALSADFSAAERLPSA
jgi:hypothetical protein